MNNCQVGEKSENGPLTPHPITIRNAKLNAAVLPAAFDTRVANRSKTDYVLFFVKMVYTAVGSNVEFLNK